MLRYVGLDVHKVWTQVARHLPDGSVLREKVATCPELLKEFADTLGPHDVVALESTINAMAVARLLRRRAGQVLISNPTLRPTRSTPTCWPSWPGAASCPPSGSRRRISNCSGDGAPTTRSWAGR